LTSCRDFVMLLTEHLCYNDRAETVWVSVSCFAFNLRYNLVTALIPPDRLSNDTDTELAQYRFKADSMKQKCTWCGGSLENVGEGTYRCTKCWAEFITAEKREQQIEDMNRNRPPQTPKFNKAKIPDHIRWAVWERDNFTCKHCGTRRNLSVDHIYPESLGGETTVENCQTLCKSCNSRKGIAL
jgi:5-methylcytosine-specific restriction endonuclease McrA